MKKAQRSGKNIQFPQRSWLVYRCAGMIERVVERVRISGEFPFECLREPFHGLRPLPC
jgi:hypothetical protein